MGGGGEKEVLRVRKGSSSGRGGKERKFIFVCSRNCLYEGIKQREDSALV